MDLVYIPEVFTYGYSRNPQYRDYEQPWNKDYFKYNNTSEYSFFFIGLNLKLRTCLWKQIIHIITLI